MSLDLKMKSCQGAAAGKQQVKTMKSQLKNWKIDKTWQEQKVDKNLDVWTMCTLYLKILKLPRSAAVHCLQALNIPRVFGE